MSFPSRRNFLVAGIALIVLTNAIALGGVAWNRGGEPECELNLGMRELRVTRGSFNRESNGVMLDLVWRTPVRDSKDLSMWGYGGGTPPWLDDAKMAELGFVAPDMKTYSDLSRRRGFSREVLLVLELDGPARQTQLEQVRAKTTAQIEKASMQPDVEGKRNVTQALEWLQREENEFSRLFAVDAGLDRETLRQRYPDRARHAIVPGRIVSAFERKGQGVEMRGRLIGDANIAINVPYEFRSQFADYNRSPRDNAREELKAASITVAFGRRLEPWIVTIDRAAAR